MREAVFDTQLTRLDRSMLTGHFLKKEVNSAGTLELIGALVALPSSTEGHDLYEVGEGLERFGTECQSGA